MTIQAGLCQTCSETGKTCFLASQFNDWMFNMINASILNLKTAKLMKLSFFFKLMSFANLENQILKTIVMNFL